MKMIVYENVTGKLPVAALERAMRKFLEPVAKRLPDKRLREVGRMVVRGILAAQSLLVTKIASALERAEESVRPTARRIYRFLWNERLDHRHLLKGLYSIAQRIVRQYEGDHLVVAIDPVNFEKPYTEALEGVSTVMKSTPPGPRGSKRLTSGYPAITATVVNLPVPVITYANWFSYRTTDFVSENREIYRALRITRALFPQRELCFVGDAGLDDQKIFEWIEGVRADFVIRASHWERLVEVYNARLDRWESESLGDLAVTVPFFCRWKVTFRHAHRRRVAEVGLGWFQFRLPERSDTVLWALVAHDLMLKLTIIHLVAGLSIRMDLDRDLLLITTMPLQDEGDARTVYERWRRRSHIEHTYRFDQERGLDVEDICVHTLERMRRLFVLVLLATLFVYHVDETWPRRAVLWLRRLGGKLDLPVDSDGPYILLAGIGSIFVAAATLSFATLYPFPEETLTYG